MTTRIRCQVLEVPAHDDWLPRGRDWPRDLLPWADPYIARLICRLEERYAAEEDDDLTDPRTAEDASWSPDAYDDGWEDGAFMPRQLEPTRFRWFPPIYGGFPLLDDVCQDDDANAL
jgi:hypothetical protein